MEVRAAPSAGGFDGRGHAVRRLRARLDPDGRGQSLVEFALVVPILLLLVLAISDFGRIYESMVAVEAAAREAADYGAFKSAYWEASLGNPAITTSEMERRACTAAAGSHLEDYRGAADGTTCTNPGFSCQIEPPAGSGEVDQACATYGGTYCSSSTSDPPCTVHVTLTYAFRAFLTVPPLPRNVTFTRDSQFRVSDLAVPTAVPSGPAPSSAPSSAPSTAPSP